MTALSKFLSLILRHQPERVGLRLDAQGWVEIDVLVAKCRAHGSPLTRESVEQLVASSEKRRFAISEDGRRIRANQGHSVPIDLSYPAAVPPAVLYHGTPEANVERIRKQGLLKMQRHHVHLSSDRETARVVGVRRGSAVILRIHALVMHEAGHVFFLSANGVWLVDHVPPEFIAFAES
ncbi:RNA 2'-phosphotransferase [Myxococcaceae bacterium JPH2]|nr:RNA 2'-phosphotransferase [Myxococcaceae bacterium JPH2]